MRPSRRQFVQGVGVVGLGLLAGCGRPPGQAQPPAKVARIGFLTSGFSDDPALNLHRLGTDIGCRLRHSFDPNAHRVQAFKSGGANAPCEEDER